MARGMSMASGTEETKIVANTFRYEHCPSCGAVLYRLGYGRSTNYWAIWQYCYGGCTWMGHPILFERPDRKHPWNG